MGLWWILKNWFTIRCHQSNVASWKIPALNEGCSWENHRTKWWIFQQTTFDYRMVREFEGKIMENQVLGALPALPSNRAFLQGFWHQIWNICSPSIPTVAGISMCAMRCWKYGGEAARPRAPNWAKKFQKVEETVDNDAPLPANWV